MSNQKAILKSVMKTLEAKGEQQVRELMKSNNNNNNVDAGNSLLNIMKEGGKEFEQKMGRPMTYAEMRNMYG